MIKNRKKTLLAASVLVPGLISTAYQCPVNNCATQVSGANFSGSCGAGDLMHDTYGSYDGPEITLSGFNYGEDCSGNGEYTNAVGPVTTTAMSRSAFWEDATHRWGQSSVYAVGGEGHGLTWGS